MHSADRNWSSLHVFTDVHMYSEEFDRLVLHVARPTVEALASLGKPVPWFFVRYSSAGRHHLRLRVQHDEALLESRIESFLREYISNTNRQFGDLVSGFEWSLYEPEVQRYGGVHSLPYCEEFFAHSSESVSHILAALPRGSRPTRLGRGALLALILVGLFYDRREIAAEWFRCYGRDMGLSGAVASEVVARASSGSLADYLHEAWRYVRDGRSLGATYDQYAEASGQLKAACRRFWLQGTMPSNPSGRLGVWSLLAGQVHMTFNRMGISRDEEAYLAHVISFALSEDR